jgi:hypothetical protein
MSTFPTGGKKPQKGELSKTPPVQFNWLSMD